jgi:hypothetical protein
VKNLMIHVSPKRPDEGLLKAQIDNAFLMGWKDVMLVTNFPYKYKGIKSVVVPDSCWYKRRPRGTKLTTICYLFDQKMIDDEMWYHDLDAFQLTPLEPDLGEKDAGFTTYNSDPYLTNWNSGSFFFKPSAKDLFGWIKDMMFERNCHDEQALCILARNNYNNINSRYKMLNCTYNLCRVRNTPDMYEQADKPIRVLHFDPRVKYDNLKHMMPFGLLVILGRWGYE